MSWILRVIEDNIGTLVKKQEYAYEHVLPHNVLLSVEVDGYCVHRSAFDNLIKRMVAASPNSPCAARTISKLAKKEMNLGLDITHIILTPAALNFSTSRCGFFKSTAVLRALLNHERFHSITMNRSTAWCEIADVEMTRLFGSAWTKCSDAILSTDIYAKQLEQMRDKISGAAWISATEGLARVAAMLHAPAKHRVAVAKNQLKCDHKCLVELTNAVAQHWSTAEKLVGWIDHIYGMRSVAMRAQTPPIQEQTHGECKEIEKNNPAV